MSRGVHPSPWQAPYHGLHRAAQRRRRFTSISSRIPKWPNQRRFSKMEAQNRRIHHGANSRQNPLRRQPYNPSASRPRHHRLSLGSATLPGPFAPSARIAAPASGPSLFPPDQPRSFTPFGPSIQVSAAASRLPPFALPHHAHPHFPQSVDAPSRIGRHGGCGYSIFSGNTAFVQLNRL